MDKVCFIYGTFSELADEGCSFIVLLNKNIVTTKERKKKCYLCPIMQLQHMQCFLFLTTDTGIFVSNHNMYHQMIENRTIAS